jgi:hypothetical protein
MRPKLLLMIALAHGGCSVHRPAPSIPTELGAIDPLSQGCRRRPLVYFVAVVAAVLLSGCAAYMAENGPDSPWMQCARVSGGPSKAAQIGVAVGGVAGIVADPGYFQAVQDCRRNLMEQAK